MPTKRIQLAAGSTVVIDLTGEAEGDGTSGDAAMVDVDVKTKMDISGSETSAKNSEELNQNLSVYEKSDFVFGRRV